MNVADSELVETILENAGYHQAGSIEQADVVLVNTCAIRENAEKKIWNKLKSNYSILKKKNGAVLGVLGCMAERVKEEFLNDGSVDLVAGPDAYRDLPRLLRMLDSNEQEHAMNV